MSCDPVISVVNISKRFEMYAQPRDRLLQFISLGKRQYFKEFWALRDISFVVNKGETVGIIGRNGSGKSTLLQIIAGTLSATSGHIETSGLITALLELGSGFNPEFSGRENIYLNGSILGLDRKEIDKRFDDIAAFADIGEHLDQPIKTYSSGMSVRLAFAVQACVSPDILIVDEALAVGDEKFQRKCFDHIERLRGNGCSILLVTHSTETIEKFCQRGILLHKGVMHGIGPAKEIVDQYHALLYSDERAYLHYVNETLQQQDEKTSIPGDETDTGNNFESPDPAVSKVAEHGSRLRAVIKCWNICNQAGEKSEVFKPGERANIQFDVDILQPIQEMQAGILIRTIEGVSAFGTSTLYHDLNYLNAKPGTTIRFEFELDVSLCSGTYFITLAIAQAISRVDMEYLDRKTDVILIKVSQPRLFASGIAMLNSRIHVEELSVSTGTG